MNVSSAVGGRLIVARETINGDVVADDVLVGVDTEVEHASAALETAGELILRVDDLVRAGHDRVGRGEVERTISLPLSSAVLEGVGALGGGLSLSGGSEDEGNESGLHLVC